MSNLSDSRPRAVPANREPTGGGALGDVLVGAQDIARFIFGHSSRERCKQIYHFTSSKVPHGRRLPSFHLGTLLCARKSSILRWIEQQERHEDNESETGETEEELREEAAE